MKHKTCIKCGIVHNLDSFPKRKDSKDGRNNRCKTCSSKLYKEHYRKYNKKAIVSEKAKTRRKELQARVNDIKSKYGCCYCKENHHCCLDFHHLDKSTKQHTVSYWVIAKSFTNAIAEINRCVVLCANCHRKVESGVFINPDKKFLCNETI